MNEISQLLEQRFGLTPDQAQQAEAAILGIVRNKVPAQFQGIFDQLVGQQGGQAADGSAPSGGLGGLLGEAEGLLGVKL
ncbi:MAG TPA: hypothetical protein VHW46_00250 [Terracidiphilus sp.]|jgi:uncharacterized protein YidB (DUF937 family)|nr:hypothetical protein [Terracidiphilus sp.]